MVPDIAKTGRSFNGAMAYYLHDKRQEGAQAHPQTAERVAWTETRNLPTNDPDTARRVMAFTASHADELKAAAGIKNTGRKSTAAVYAYSLAWHPDEAGALDRAEMLRAVDGSLKALGAENHQAVIVCHADQKHPHVHVILNRVDPKTGVMLSTSNDRLKLSDWANAYERERGLILTPKREEKRQMREQFAEKAERRQYAEQKRKEQAQRPASSKSAGAMLKEFADRQKADHRQQWRDLSASNKAARDRIFTESGAAIKKAAADHKTLTRPMWADHFRAARKAERAFLAREQSLSGIVRNAINATTHQKVSEQLGNRGTLSATFSNVLSSEARRAAFDAQQDMSKQAISRRLKNVLDAEVRTIKERRDAALQVQRQTFDAARASLIEKQDAERAKMREAWRQHYADRGRPNPNYQGRSTPQPKPDYSAHRRKMEVRNQINSPDNAARETRQDRRASNTALKVRKAETQARQNAAPQQEQKPMKREFDTARRIERAPIDQKPAFVARPAPAPSPAGDVPKPPQRTVQQVPVKAEPTFAPSKTPAPVSRSFDQAAAKAATQDVKRDFAAMAKAERDKPREIKPLPPRNRDRDRER